MSDGRSLFDRHVSGESRWRRRAALAAAAGTIGGSTCGSTTSSMFCAATASMPGTTSMPGGGVVMLSDLTEPAAPTDLPSFLQELLDDQQSLTAVERFAQKHCDQQLPLRERY